MDKPLKKNGYVRTTIILGADAATAAWCPCDGLAKNLEIAVWMFKYLGWNDGTKSFPDLIYQIEEGALPEEWEEAHPGDPTELYILSCTRHPLLMN